MTVRTSAPITFGPHDFSRTDRGVTWGIKVTATSDASFVMVFIQGPDGRWLPDTQLQSAQLDAAFETAISRGGPVIDWFVNTLLPALNRWLREKFPPLDATAPPTPTTYAEQADALIRGIRITAHADGTLTAS